MADLHDIEQSLVAAITQAVYPDGTSGPSIAGVPVIVYRGWPVPGNLTAALAAGKINISVYPSDIEQKTTRYPREWQTATLPNPALTLTASGNTISVGGTPSSPLNAAAVVNGKGYVYPVQPSDTLATIATGLATAIDADIPASSSGAIVTIPAARNLRAMVGGVGTIIRELKRQKRSFQVVFWCPDPATRDQIAAAVDGALAKIDFLALPDGTGGRLLYERSRVTDQVEREGLYRRDLIYSVEYATTDSQAATQIVAQLINLTDRYDNPMPPVRPPAPRGAMLDEAGSSLVTEAGVKIDLENSLA